MFSILLLSVNPSFGDSDEYTITISNELQILNNQIKSEMLNESSTSTIQELQIITDSYVDTINDLNAYLNIERNIDFINEWFILDTKIMDMEITQSKIRAEIFELRQLQENVSVLDLQNEFNDLSIQISQLVIQRNAIEQKNIESLKMDSDLEQELIEIESTLYSKYLDKPSENYVGSNPVELVYIDYVQKKAILTINPDFEYLEPSDYELSVVGISHTSLTEIGSEKLKIDFDVPQLTSCISKTDECRPLIGSIELKV